MARAGRDAWESPVDQALRRCGRGDISDRLLEPAEVDRFDEVKRKAGCQAVLDVFGAPKPESAMPAIGRLSRSRHMSSSPLPSWSSMSLTRTSNSASAASDRAAAMESAGTTSSPRMDRSRVNDLSVSTLSSTSRIRSRLSIREVKASGRSLEAAPAGLAAIGGVTEGISTVKMAPRPLPRARGPQAAAVLFHDRAADREAEPEPAELPRRRHAALLEDVKDARQKVGLDADARVDYLDRKRRRAHVRACLAGWYIASHALVVRLDDDRASRRGELDGVLDQVPENLLEPDRVGVDVVARGGKVDLELEPAAGEVILADLDDVIHELVCVGEFAVELQGPAADPGQVQEVVDESGFEGDVAADHLEYGPEALGRGGVVGQGGHGGEYGGQRCSQLVGDGGEEPVLGAVGGLGLGTGRLLAGACGPAPRRRSLWSVMSRSTRTQPDGARPSPRREILAS